MSRPTPQHSPVTGALAILLAVGLVPVAWLALAILLIGGFVAAQLPDPSVPDGDPCCGHPDTWGEVIGGGLFSVAVGAVLLVLLFGMFALVRWAVKGRWPSLRRWLQVAGGGAAFVAVGFGAVLTLAATARQPTDCETFALSRERFRSPDIEVRRTEARGIADCQLPGRRLDRGDVRRLLGEPVRILQPRSDQTLWRYRDLEVSFFDDEAVYAEMYPYEGRAE